MGTGVETELGRCDMNKPLIIEYCRTPLGVVFMAAAESDWETVRSSKAVPEPALLCYPTAFPPEEWKDFKALILINDPSVLFREVSNDMVRD